VNREELNRKLNNALAQLINGLIAYKNMGAEEKWKNLKELNTMAEMFPIIRRCVVALKNWKHDV
jgi:predicted RecB family endonuclease